MRVSNEEMLVFRDKRKTIHRIGLNRSMVTDQWT
ncbi:hypothetical protein ABIE48_003926 [Paenibacillus sp. OAE614]